MPKNKYIEAGRITNTHGVRGEVRVQVWLDSPEFMRTFKTLYIDGKPVEMLSSRVHKDFIIARLRGYDDVNAAMTLKGRTVYIDRDDAGLGEGEYFLSDLIGAKVVTESGEEIGTLQDILETPASPVYIVRGETEHMIPAVPEFIIGADADAGVVTVRLIDGM